jgi:hypothetical protein
MHEGIDFIRVLEESRLVRIESQAAGGWIKDNVARRQFGHARQLARLVSLAPDRMLAPGNPMS